MKPATAPDRHCNSCGTLLDSPHDPFSGDCGGDCMLCMAEAGDSDCLASVFEWCRNTFRKQAMSDENFGQLMEGLNEVLETEQDPIAALLQQQRESSDD